MMKSSCLLRHLLLFPSILLTLLDSAARFLWLCLCLPAVLAAENLFVRKSYALCRERGIKPRRASNTSRITNELLLKLGHRVLPPDRAQMSAQAHGPRARHTCDFSALAQVCP
jgi:hypothetical protein